MLAINLALLRAAEAIELGDDQLVAVPCDPQRFLELGRLASLPLA